MTVRHGRQASPAAVSRLADTALRTVAASAVRGGMDVEAAQGAMMAKIAAAGVRPPQTDRLTAMPACTEAARQLLRQATAMATGTQC